MFYSNKFKKFSKIKHCFFSKKGGYSTGIYKSLNCGEGSKDNKKKINNNLKLIAKKMKIKNNNLVLMYHTHGKRVVEIKRGNKKRKLFSDAIITKEKNIALGVVTADCVPVLIYDKKNAIFKSFKK